MTRLGAPGLLLSTLGNYTVVAGQALRTLILARLLGPAAFGVLNIANVAASFTPQSDLGCGRIGEQHASEARGRGDVETARRELIEAAGARMAPALVVCLALFVSAAFAAGRGAMRSTVLALVFVAVSAPLQSAWWAVVGWLRVQGQFRDVAWSQLGQVTIWLTLVPLAAWAYGLNGGLFALAASFVPPVLIGARHAPLWTLLRPRWAPFRRLVRPGLPVWFIFASTFAFTNVDQLMAGLLEGPEGIGLLAIGSLTASALLAFSDGAAAAAHPRTLEEYARRGRLDVRMPSIIRVMHVVQSGLAAFVPLSWLAMAAVTHVFLVRYEEALPTLALLGVAATLIGATTASNSTLQAVGLHRRVPLLLVTGTGVRVLLAWLLGSTTDLGLMAVGVSAAGASLLYALLYLVLVSRALQLPARRGVLFLTDQLLGSLVLAAGAAAAVIVWPVHGTYGFVMVSLVTLGVAGSVQGLAWLVRRRLSLLSG